MKKNVVLLRQIGKFVNVFDEDAIIISYLMDYKYINGKVGFPLISLNKVINTLENKSISYEIKGDNPIIKNFKNKNKYSSTLINANKYLNINDRYYTIKDTIKDLSVEQLERIITYIEGVINE